jgi:hypothetical protein
VWEAGAFQRVSACATGRRARRSPDAGPLRMPPDPNKFDDLDSSGVVLRVDFELDLNSPISCNPVVPDGQLARYAD